MKNNYFFKKTKQTEKAAQFYIFANLFHVWFSRI